MQSYVYILASKKNRTLYIGVTNNLIKRIYEHKNDLVEGFTKKYQVHMLVYYEIADEIVSAFEREKQLKKWKRQWKVSLIEKNNPQWEDLYNDLQ
jgi:putative endonuclease